MGRNAMKFKIEWTDPDTGEYQQKIDEFEDSPAGVCPNTGTRYGAISARMWAEDHAYMLADKGWHRVTEVKQ